MTTQDYQSVPNGFLDGFSRVRRPRPSRLLSESQRQGLALHESRVAAAAEFMSDLFNGRVPAYFLREAIAPSSPEMGRVINRNYPGLVRQLTAREAAAYGLTDLAESHTISDFPLLMGDVLDRKLLERFREVPQVWRQYIRVGMPARDFRTARMITTDGGDGQWDEISDQEGLKYTTLTETGYTISPALYGKGLRLSYRLLLNDDLNAFAEIPAVLGRGGRRTIAKFATSLLFDASGPHASFFTVGNGNIVSGNPALSITSLSNALAMFLAFTDSVGEPIALEGVRLVYGPANEINVQNIMNTLTIEQTEAGGTSARVITVNNWLKVRIQPVLDHYVPIVASGATGSWALVADPSNGRPAAEMRFLAGFDEPVLYQKAPNTQRVSGGLDDSVGDFESMATEYKGLVGFGGTQMEPKAAVGSAGTG